jgi:hypothetical protein
MPIEQMIDLFESALISYTPESGKITSDARKLIQAKFKEQLDDKIAGLL